MTPPDAALLRGGSVLDIAGDRAEPRDILVAGGRIVAVEPPGLAPPPGTPVIDMHRRLLIPGLLNAHAHSHANLPRSMGDRWTLEMGLNANPAIRGVLNLADKKLAARLGAVEMATKGCTAVYDLFYEFPLPTVEGLQAVAEAYLEVGIRAVIAPMVADLSFYEAVPGMMAALPPEIRERLLGRPRFSAREQIFAVIEEAVRTWPFDTDMVRLAIAPSIPLHCTDDFLRTAARLARDCDIGLHTHIAESKIQAVGAIERWGTPLTTAIDRLGLLGPRFVAGHGIWLGADDMKLLADRGASVAHNAGSNMRLGNGLADARAMRDAGLTVGIGSDGRGSSDNLNMFEAMRIASYTARIQRNETSRWLSAAEVLDMATIGSARTLGFDGLCGVIAPGMAADIVALDIDNLNYVPLNRPTLQVVNAEDGTGVDKVMVAGRLIVDGGRAVGVDRRAMAEAAAESMARMLGASDEARAFAATLEPLVEDYCLGLLRRQHSVQRFAGEAARF